MQAAVRRHDALLRAAIGAAGGHVFKTIGDAFCAAFMQPEAAAAAMIDAQRALAAEDFSAVGGLRVRMALHTGATDERDGDYFGPVVNRVARLLSVGHGGQMLVSGATSALIDAALPPRCVLLDLGEHRLKDLARPERVYQLVASDLAGEFPALRSLDVVAHNLPLQLTTFVGRENDIAAIAALLERHRLVTLVGSGGVGKTRTSLHVAANVLDAYADGVWFIELAPLGSGDYIPSTIAHVFGFKLPSDGDPLANLVQTLQTKRALLIFDNCEHLVAPVARVAAAIVQGCLGIGVLATSRQRLEIAGEQMYRLPSLDHPDEAAMTQFGAAQAMAYAAVALFAERARAIDHRFELTDDAAPVIADICRRLDGIPLAIELAASRVKILSPRQLRDRLNERFRVLTGGRRDVLPRQQTLRALIDWSHDLLDERERTLFRRLGIFVNGFTLESAVAVASGDDLDEFEVLDLLASLVDKSLVLAEPDGDDMRYRLLESTRVYALEKLTAAGEREAAAARHLKRLREHFAELRARAGANARIEELIAALTSELEDIRAALDAALETGAAHDGAQLLAEIGKVWSNLGLDREAVARSERYLAALGPDEARLRARLGTTLSFLHAMAGRKVQGLAVAAESVAQARAAGHGMTLAWALEQFAWNTMLLGRADDAEDALVQAEAIPDSTKQLRLRFLEKRALLAQIRGDLSMAARMYDSLRREYHALGDTRGEFVMAISQAETEHARGETNRAITIVRETLPALRAVADMSLLRTTLQNAAGYFCAVDDPAAAITAAHETIDSHAGDPDHGHVAISLEHLALARALGGDTAVAAQLHGYVDAAFERHRYHREYTETLTHDRLVSVLRRDLASDELQRLTAQGAALTPETAVALSRMASPAGVPAVEAAAPTRIQP